MKRAARLSILIAITGATVLSAVPALAQQGDGSRSRDRDRREREQRANPSKVLATELAFARAAQEKGQWTAFAEYAADDAVMFVPERVNARQWLKGQANPPQAVKWQPHQVWSSCDGTLAATRGAWQRPDGSFGYFTTVWRRKKNGDYEWVMDQGDILDQPLEAPEMMSASVAACRPRAQAPADAQMLAPSDSLGDSRDGTLHWEVVPKSDGSRSVLVRYWNGTEWTTAFSDQVPAR